MLSFELKEPPDIQNTVVLVYINIYPTKLCFRISLSDMQSNLHSKCCREEKMDQPHVYFV